jgi:hypothetical protein
MVSCECVEPEDEEFDGPEDDDYEEIDDRRVVFVIGDNGVGRVVYQ